MLHPLDARPDRERPVGEDVDLHSGRKRGLELRKEGLHRVDDLDDVRPRLPLDIDDHRRGVVHPRRLADVLRAVDHLGDVDEPDGRAVAVADDQPAKLVAREELIVGGDRERLPAAVEAPLRLVNARLNERRPQILEIHAEAGEGRGINLDADRRLLPPGDAHHPHA